MEFKRGGFVLNGKESKEFNVVMRERPTREAAGRAIELRERPGNDSIVLDFNYYKNTVQTISCYAKAKNFQEIPFLEKEITHWLDMGSYSDYLVYYDPHYIYQAIVTSAPKFTGQRKNGLLIPFEFTLSIRPFKMARVGMLWKHNEKVLTNTENYFSKPKIHLLGNGDGSFFINEREYKVKALTKELFIDSRVEESYVVKDSSIQFQDEKTLFKDYPCLDKGENQIRWTSTISKISIMPRWWTKI